MAEPKKCEHKGCTCIVPEGKSYCSEICEDSEKNGIATIACDCPHNSCGGHL